jgi:monothiol glutaredoxin
VHIVALLDYICLTIPWWLLKTDFHAVDVLQDPEIREGIKVFANWPTIPQLYIHGEFIGGADIIKEMYETGELVKLLKANS